jgi:hypothetical protein
MGQIVRVVGLKVKRRKVMEKKEKETENRVSIVELVGNEPEGRYILDEEAYMGMIDEYVKYREYILDMLMHVHDLDHELDHIYNPKGGDYDEVMWEIFEHIEKHRRVEKEIGYELYKTRNILEKMKENRKSKKLGKITVIEPWGKSPLEEIVKSKPEMDSSGWETFHCGGEKQWTLDWKAYEIMLEQFMKYRKVVMDSLERTTKLDGVDGDPDDMFWELIESWGEMMVAEYDALGLLDQLYCEMSSTGELLYNKKKPKNLVKLAPFRLCDYDNPRWVKMGKNRKK